MAKKKIQLSDLKVKSFVTSLPRQERKTAKGGYVKIVGRLHIDYQIGQFTDHKSQLSPTQPDGLMGNNPLSSITGKEGR